MDKRPVTRTFSIGAVCSRTEASDGFAASRRHSSAGIRAMLWSSSSSKSFCCSRDSQTSRENIFSNVLTPDSIPQFTIPSLSIQPSGPELEGVSPSRTSISSSSSSSCSSLVPSNRRAERCASDPLAKRRSLLQRDGPDARPRSGLDPLHCLDPASKAALSLPHLAKVATPYGFITLSQSPQMASEEALLCQVGVRRLNSTGRASGWNADGTRGSCFHLTGAKQKLCKGTSDPQRKETSEPRGSVRMSASSSPAPKNPEKLKRRFYHIIKKHFL